MAHNGTGDHAPSCLGHRRSYRRKLVYYVMILCFSLFIWCCVAWTLFFNLLFALSSILYRECLFSHRRVMYRIVALLWRYEIQITNIVSEVELPEITHWDITKRTMTYSIFYFILWRGCFGIIWACVPLGLLVVDGTYFFSDSSTHTLLEDKLMIMRCVVFAYFLFSMWIWTMMVQGLTKVSCYAYKYVFRQSENLRRGLGRVSNGIQSGLHEMGSEVSHPPIHTLQGIRLGDLHISRKQNNVINQPAFAFIAPSAPSLPSSTTNALDRINPLHSGNTTKANTPTRGNSTANRLSRFPQHLNTNLKREDSWGPFGSFHSISSDIYSNDSVPNNSICGPKFETTDTLGDSTQYEKKKIQLLAASQSNNLSSDGINSSTTSSTLTSTSLELPLPSIVDASSHCQYDTLSPNSNEWDYADYTNFSPNVPSRNTLFGDELSPQVFRDIPFHKENKEDHSSITAAKNLSINLPSKYLYEDKVQFAAYAQPYLNPISLEPYLLNIYAFLQNQEDEVREIAITQNKSNTKMSKSTSLQIQKGTSIHITLEVPKDFVILNDSSQVLIWDGDIVDTNFRIMYDSRQDNIDAIANGQVMFTSTIVVGSQVAVLRSYVMVSTIIDYSTFLEYELVPTELEVLNEAFNEIKYTDIEIEKLIGKGYFGDAYLGKYNGEDVVLKSIRASEFGETTDEIVQEFQHEAAILSMFGHHPNIVPFLGVCTDPSFPLGLITKYVAYGSLKDHFQSNSVAALTLAQKDSLLVDIAAGTLNIHQGRFIHRDIAARNCLVDANYRGKICDFGLCRRIGASGSSFVKDGIGPLRYMAPESLQPPHIFTEQSDSYMYGILIWETLTEMEPFGSISPFQAAVKVLEGERLDIPVTISEGHRNLMTQCFKQSPQDRPIMAEIYQTLKHLQHNETLVS